jgi:hypothetical protein
MRKRFDTEKRAEILGYIEKYNASHKGRGGQSAAAKKFKVSRVAINNWLRSGVGAKKAAKGAKPIAIAAPKSVKLVNKKKAPVIIALEIIKGGVAALEKALKASD